VAHDNAGTSSEKHPEKRCFVVSAFGETPEERARTKQVLRHLVRKVLSPLGYAVVRADEIDDEGLITNQVIEHLLEDELVIADLSGRNPNVFYEVAVRHAVARPVVHLITAGETIPFDVAHMRAVTYALDDPDLLEEAQDELRRKVAAIEHSEDKPAINPITVAREVGILRSSDMPEIREAGNVLAALNDIRDQLRSLSIRNQPSVEPEMRRPETVKSGKSLDVVLRTALPHESPGAYASVQAVWDIGPASIKRIAYEARYAHSTVARYMHSLEASNVVERVGGGEWDLAPAFRDYVERQWHLGR
jgi:hypothetical protein